MIEKDDKVMKAEIVLTDNSRLTLGVGDFIDSCEIGEYHIEPIYEIVNSLSFIKVQIMDEVALYPTTSIKKINLFTK